MDKKIDFLKRVNEGHAQDLMITSARPSYMVIRPDLRDHNIFDQDEHNRFIRVKRLLNKETEDDVASYIGSR